MSADDMRVVLGSLQVYNFDFLFLICFFSVECAIKGKKKNRAESHETFIIESLCHKKRFVRRKETVAVTFLPRKRNGKSILRAPT